MPWGKPIRPWSAVQAVATHHGGAAQRDRSFHARRPRLRACGRGSLGGRGGRGRLADTTRRLDEAAVSVASGGGGPGRKCALHVVFADRKGRRKLRNIRELVAACAAWRPPSPHAGLAVNCTAHNFGVGLVASLDVLARTDVLVVPHGADIINGFGLHAGASVVEVMPIKQFQYGCPCDMYRRMYTYEGPTVFHHQLVSTNASLAVSEEPRKKVGP